MPTPEERLALLQKLAAAFPDAPAIQISLIWENEQSTAGVVSAADGTYVFLNNAQQNVETLGEASELLARIFRDEVVALTAYQGEALVNCVLGPADDPPAGFGGLSRPYSSSRQEPDIDSVLIENWSGGEVEQE